MINYSLECDFYQIVKEGKLPQCQEVDGKFTIHRIVNESTQIDYFYPTKQTRDADHYELAQMYFNKKLT